MQGEYKGQVVAVKVIKFNKAEDESQLSTVSQIDAFKEFRREVWIMSGLIHPNLVIMNGFTLNPITIVTEFIPHGTLYDLIHMKKDFELTWPLRRVPIDMQSSCSLLLISYVDGASLLTWRAACASCMKRPLL